MKPFDYYQPETLRDAFELKEKAGDGGYYIAGGTDLIVRVKQGILLPEALISLRGIAALSGIQPNGDLTIGGLTLLRDLERDGAIQKDYPALFQAVSWLANPQVRNVATVGGNLSNAAPSADCAPPLLILEAVLTLEGPGGVRKVPIEKFFTGPGKTCMDGAEVLTRIEIPRRAKASGMAFLKIGRVARDIAKSNAAALVVMDGDICRTCRLAAGAVAPVPMRLKEVEKQIVGRPIDGALLEEVQKRVAQEVRPITDVRSTEAYRRAVTGVLVKRALEKALDDVRGR